MKIISLAYAFTMVLILAGSTGVRAASETPVTLITIGDSYITSYGIYPSTGGFRAVLERTLAESGHVAEVIDAGFRRTSEDGLNWVRSPDGMKLIEKSLNPAIILELGNNDCNSFISLEQTRTNLEEILKNFYERAIPVLLVGTIAPENCGEEYVADFSQMFVDLSEKHQVLLYPDFLSGITGNLKLFQIDRDHPNAAGMVIVVENVMPVVEALIARIKR